MLKNIAKIHRLRAWKTDDKDWMKARRAGWKEVKMTLDRLTGVRGQDKKFLKQFYMSGEVDIDAMVEEYGRRAVNPEKPLQPMDAPVLLECWLTADQSEENWQNIKDSYADWELQDSCRRLLESLAYYPETGALFGGLEERLYRFLCPTRCRPEDYPNLNHSQYLDHARVVYGNVCLALMTYFAVDPPNPNNFIYCRLSEWHDSIIPTFQKKPDALLNGLHKYVIPMHKILNHPDAYPEIILKTVKQLEAILKDEELPQAIRDKVDEIINNADQYDKE